MKQGGSFGKIILKYEKLLKSIKKNYYLSGVHFYYGNSFLNVSALFLFDRFIFSNSL